MANTIVSIMNDPNSIKPEIIDINLPLHYAKMFREAVMKLRYPNLTKILKWPKIAYNLFNDVPYRDEVKYH